jgi:pimeloyl-ACP methyl ester carboxylesterase
MGLFSRRATLAGFAGSLSAATLAVPAQAAPRQARERVYPAQTQWSDPPPLKPAREGLVKLPKTQLWFQDTGGPGEAVVFLHAYTGSYAVWGYQQAAFVAAGYRVITYSMRGYYRSDPINPDAPGTATEDLRDLLDYLGVKRAHLVGSAGGGLLVPDFELSYPGRALSLTIASSIAGIKEPEFLAVDRRMFPPGVYGISHSFSELGPSYRAGNLRGVEMWEAAEKTAWGGGKVRQPMNTPLTWDRLAGIRIPLLLMSGDADLIMPPSRMREVARRTPRAELAIIAEAGHSIYWEQPDAFNKAVLDFIRRSRNA